MHADLIASTVYTSLIYARNRSVIFHCCLIKIIPNNKENYNSLNSGLQGRRETTLILLFLWVLLGNEGKWILSSMNVPNSR